MKNDKTMEKVSADKIVSLAAFIKITCPAILSSRKAVGLRVTMPLESDR